MKTNLFSLSDIYMKKQSNMLLKMTLGRGPKTGFKMKKIAFICDCFPTPNIIYNQPFITPYSRLNIFPNLF